MIFLFPSRVMPSKLAFGGYGFQECNIKFYRVMAKYHGVVFNLKRFHIKNVAV